MELHYPLEFRMRVLLLGLWGAVELLGRSEHCPFIATFFSVMSSSVVPLWLTDWDSVLGSSFNIKAGCTSETYSEALKTGKLFLHEMIVRLYRYPARGQKVCLFRLTNTAYKSKVGHNLKWSHLRYLWLNIFSLSMHFPTSWIYFDRNYSEKKNSFHQNFQIFIKLQGECQLCNQRCPKLLNCFPSSHYSSKYQATLEQCYSTIS